MTARRQSVQTRSETGTRKPGTGIQAEKVPAQQYVEGLNGETARRSRVSALAAEALMNNAGQVAISLACIYYLQEAVMVFTGESGDCEAYTVMPVRGVRPPSSFTPCPCRILAFSLSSLVSWL